MRNPDNGINRNPDNGLKQKTDNTMGCKGNLATQKTHSIFYIGGGQVENAIIYRGSEDCCKKRSGEGSAASA